MSASASGQQETRVAFTTKVAPDEGLEAYDEFGSATAISGDWAAVAARRDGGAFSSRSGAVYLFHRSEEGWAYYSRLMGTAPSSFRDFGRSLAFDGERLVVGAPGYRLPNGVRAGAVYVFEKVGHQWEQTALVPSPLAGVTGFGLTVAASAGHVLASAPSAREGRGVVYALGREAGEWAVVDSLEAEGETGEQFGARLDLDGHRAVILESTPSVLHVVERGPSGWVETHREVIEDPSVEVVDLALSGTRLAFTQKTNGANAARIVLLERDASRWSPSDTLSPQRSDEGFRDLGRLDMDGDRLVAYASRPGPDGRAILYYRRGSAHWYSETIPEPDGYASDGYQLALDGSRLLLGNRDGDGSGVRRAGSAEVRDFSNGPLAPVRVILRVPGVGRRDSKFGSSVALHGGTLAATASGVGDVVVFEEVLTPEASEWQTAAYFDERISDRVSLRGEWLLAGGEGSSVRVYRRDGGAWAEHSSLGVGSAFAVKGDRAIVGAPSASGGSVTMYRLNGDRWQRSPTAITGESGDSRFGYAVAIEDGRALVASRKRRADGDYGEVHVYDETSDGEWERTGSLAPEGKGIFGTSVHLSGGRAYAGVPSFTGSSVVVETVAVHEGPDLARTAVLDSPLAPSLFGSAMSVDGDRVLIGSPVADIQGEDSGAAYLFTFDGSHWSDPLLILAPRGEPGDRFGTAVAISGDRLAIGAPLAFESAREAGVVYLFAATTIVSTDEDAPLAETALSRPFPNPARGGTSLWLNLRDPTHVTVTLHDARGRTVRTLLAREVAARTEVGVDTRGLAPGLCAVRATWEGGMQTRVLTVVR